jgi:hypothetical protein
MALLSGHKQNFETLRRAMLAGDAALMECQHATSGETVAVICAVNRHAEKPEEEFEFVPVAMMFNDNPYGIVNPPNPGGGFCTQEETANSR